jgi:hypothetical protein
MADRAVTTALLLARLTGRVPCELATNHPSWLEDQRPRFINREQQRDEKARI